jgi:hypothetical protein
VTPDARELHRVITASVHELLETARLEGQADAMDAAQVERLIFRAAAPIVHSVAPLTRRSAASYSRISSA